MKETIEKLLSNFDYQKALGFLQTHLKDNPFLIKMLSKGDSAFNRRQAKQALQKLYEQIKESHQGTAKEVYPFEVASYFKEKSRLYKEAIALKVSLINLSEKERKQALTLLLSKWNRLYELWGILDYYEQNKALPAQQLKPVKQYCFQGLTLRKLLNREEALKRYIARFSDLPDKKELIEDKTQELKTLTNLIDTYVI